MRRRGMLGVAGLWLALGGCGGSVVEGGGSGGAGPTTTGGGGTSSTTSTTATTSTSGGGGTVVPPDCEGPGTSGPHATTFRFVNSGPTVFMREECRPVFRVTACADDYASSLALFGDCTIDCSDPSGGCIACGACFLTGKPVAPATPVEVTWQGSTFTFSQTSDGCPCHVPHAAPSAKYRVTVPVYATLADAEAGIVAYETSTDFVLPAPGGVVDVSLAP